MNRKMGSMLVINKKEILLSIIIPIYNSELYLRRCLDSVISQTYKNLEIICVDDGSTDKSCQILDEYKEKDSRIIILKSNHQGVSAARNAGLDVATGDYIGFVDSDDYISKEMYEQLISKTNDGQVDIVSCGYYMSYDNNDIPMCNKDCVPENTLSSREFLIYMYERDKYKNVASYLWTRIIGIELINGEVPIRFDEELKIGEDILFLAEICIRANLVSHIDKCLYYYYQRDNSAVHCGVNQLEKLDWIISYERIIELYRKENVDEYVINIIIRMYCYRCGKTLELAIQKRAYDKIDILKNKINKELNIYLLTNKDNIDRQNWIKDLLLINGMTND